MKKALSIITAMVIAGSISSNVFAAENLSVKRIYGQDRYNTSFNICNNFSNEKVKNVIVASGSDFADALAGSALSKQLDAPIILTGNNKEDSRKCIEYIKNKVAQDGKVFVLGGNASVSESIVEEIKSLGHTDITRLGGQDRFATNKSIVTQGNIAKGTPIVIANAYGFADALSVSSIASIKGYPIVMTSRDELSSDIKKIIEDVQPSEVFVIGGQGSVGDKVVEEVKGLAPKLDSNKITRLGGINRYETSMKVLKHFDLNTDSAVVANGEAFPDALSGSALASKVNAPIILTNGKDIATQKEYMDTKNYSNLYILGGIGVVDLTAEYTLKAGSISDAERKEVDELLIVWESFINFTKEADKQMIEMQSNIERKLNNLDKSQSLSDLENYFEILKQFSNSQVDFLRSTDVFFNDMKSNLEKIEGDGSIDILKNQFLEEANSSLTTLSEVDRFIKENIGILDDILDAIKTKDKQKYDNAIRKMELLSNKENPFENVDETGISMENMTLKLIELKQIINAN